MSMPVYRIIFMLMCLLGLLPASAQYFPSKVGLVDYDDETKTAVFFSEGYGANKKEAVENSRIVVLQKLLYEGVEGINNDFPIVKRSAKNHLWLQNFFNGKNAPYKSFLGEIEVIGSFTETDTKQLYCRTHVVIKFDFLMKQARIQGLTNTNSPTYGSNQPNGSTPKPRPHSFLD